MKEKTVLYVDMLYEYPTTSIPYTHITFFVHREHYIYIDIDIGGYCVLGLLSGRDFFLFSAKI